MNHEARIRFLASDGVADWVVLHGGAVAVYAVDSLSEAAELAASIARVVASDPHMLMTAGAERLTIRLTRDVWQLEQRHVDLARQISELARDAGAIPDRGSVQEVQLAIAAPPESINIAFWHAVLGYTPSADDSAIDPLGHGSTVWMQDLDAKGTLRHAMHVDVSVPREEAPKRLEAALNAGGRIVDDSEAPRWWTLSDPAGNRVCVAAWPDTPELND